MVLPPATVNAARERVVMQLMDACGRGDTEEASRLITLFGIDVNRAASAYAPTPNFTPLHMAAMKGHAGTVRALVTRFGAAVNAVSAAEMTPLHYAASGFEEGLEETCRVLVEELGADFTARDKNGWTPFYVAARTGKFQTVFMLARLGVDVNFAPPEKLDEAAVSADGGEASPKSAPTVLHFAAWRGRMDVIRTLITDFGADVNAIDAGGKTLLHFAADSDSTEAAVALVREFGFDIEAKTNSGCTPLHMAIRSNCSKTARGLVDTLGASLVALNGDGLSPLHIAAEEGYVDSALMLMALGADVSAPAAKGWAPLHFAAMRGSAAVVKALLDNGADPEATDAFDHTATFFAAMSEGRGPIRVGKVLAEAVGA